MQKTNIRNEKVRLTVLISIFSAMSFVLFLFPKFPLLAAFPWLDIDFSDVPALFASVMISPVAGLAVCLIKNVIHLSVTSTAMVGELSNFLVNGSFVFATGLAYKYVMKKNAKIYSIAVSVVIGVLVQVIAAIIVNYYIMIPMYSAFVNFSELGGAKGYILAGVIPFNLVKDVMASTVFIVLYKLVGNKLHRYSVK